MGASTSVLLPESVPASLASLWGLMERVASWISKGTTDLRICTKVDCEELVDCFALYWWKFNLRLESGNLRMRLSDRLT